MTLPLLIPKDMQDGLIDVGPDDITTNLPYVAGAFLAFDHHASEMDRVGGKRENHIIDPKAPSAARVVYDYFGGKAKFPKISEDMMRAVDKADSAALHAGRYSRSLRDGSFYPLSWMRGQVWDGFGISIYPTIS
jgi:hypothetical protein